jgi:hypothetical protein
MSRLGYKQYAAQGGDWGAAVTTCIGIQDPANCIGIHLNMPIAPPDPATANDLTEKEKSAIAGIKYYNDWDSGYSKQQSTRPQTVGYGLCDSPVGQMAWILEKFWSWTDCDGHPEKVLTRDELLDNVMLYWLTGSAASSARLYWESFRSFPTDPVTVPTGCSIFPKEIFRTSRRWADKRFTKLVYFNELEKGGISPRSSSRRHSCVRCVHASGKSDKARNKRRAHHITHDQNQRAHFGLAAGALERIARHLHPRLPEPVAARVTAIESTRRSVGMLRRLLF